MCFTPCVHFVGFRDDAYTRAVRVFGKPDFVHRSLDLRALTDIAPGDTVVFAREKDWDRLMRGVFPPFSFNDSEEF
jgi:hypothetical protein